MNFKPLFTITFCFLALLVQGQKTTTFLGTPVKKNKSN